VKATGAGLVTFSGQKNGYGNVIELQHGEKYSTLYGHLSRFAEGLRVGESVKQGQVIGYVGQTGLATGPHLHYEFRVAGEHRDPLSTKLPTAEKLDGQDFTAFRKTVAPLLAQLDRMERTMLARAP
jgi:murein DD-endopeptidase MepM/ murein hydrolase activator NlpD